MDGDVLIPNGHVFFNPNDWDGVRKSLLCGCEQCRVGFYCSRDMLCDFCVVVVN